MSQTQSYKYEMPYLNGFVMLAILVGATLFAIILFFAGSVVSGVVIAPVLYCVTRFYTIPPNTALVGTLFGKYAGILPRSGFYWLIPFYNTTTVSLKTSNYVTATLKVNDASGTPIEIAAAIVYHIENPAAAVLDVENVYSFLQIQSESALRTLATHYPYTNDGNSDSLSGNSESIIKRFENMVQERVELAGIAIDEVRFTHLAYAPEIAQAMLRRQQAEAVILARQTLVRGAISMVGGTVKELEKRGIVNMNDSEKAKLVTNMMTVLLSEENASPVLNVSGD
ncbi:SPFH domain-containing protein [Wielerella bovis]|uniref:SPFH domain-containing protein n=1 Tax=Wielerella bovis TaxID=2917790 RepID=UPI002018BB8E|nr:SPFH domain-containing protein [Wielerella bovis]ULJ62525.1 SPFH domain-containing protein [Wielerella bovis]ULJ64750.1 SPFH domain-containing protein [Wielerella bovis]ULJ67022.1 SPFH domain-containing protein [Wielerella bovis]